MYTEYKEKKRHEETQNIGTRTKEKDKSFFLHTLHFTNFQSHLALFFFAKIVLYFLTDIANLIFRGINIYTGKRKKIGEKI